MKNRIYLMCIDSCYSLDCCRSYGIFRITQFFDGGIFARSPIHITRYNYSIDTGTYHKQIPVTLREQI
jgi:hypothetical protein